MSPTPGLLPSAEVLVGSTDRKRAVAIHTEVMTRVTPVNTPIKCRKGCLVEVIGQTSFWKTQSPISATSFPDAQFLATGLCSP